jgi:predicted SAM-dependent methyltransferase
MVNELKIDLACGVHKKPGYYGIDSESVIGVDCVMDLQQYPWDIESDSVEDIHCSHYIEHIKHDNVALDLAEIVNKSNTFEEFKVNINNKEFLQANDGLVKFMNEVYRILKPGGKITIIAPFYASKRAFQDPTHQRFMTESSFNYFNKQWLGMVGMNQYELNIKCDFDLNVSYLVTNEMTLKSEEIRQKAFENDWNVIDDVIVEMTKRN